MSTQRPQRLDSAGPFLWIATWLWALSFIAARYEAPGGLSAFTVIGGRTLLAATCFALMAAFGKVSTIPRRDMALLFAVAASGQFGYLLLFHLGAAGATAATASLLINLSPVIGTVASALWLHDHLSTLNKVGVALAVAGTIPVSLADGGGIRLSASIGYLLAAAVLAGIFVVASKPLVDRHGAMTVTAWGWWLSTPLALLFVPTMVRELPDAGSSALTALLFLGLGSSVVAYLAWGHGLVRTDASVASAYLFAVPVIAVLGAWIILGERPGPATAIGGAIALCGVALATRRG